MKVTAGKKVKQLLPALVLILTCACGTGGYASPQENSTVESENLKVDHQMKLDYANQFQVECYQDGYRLITINDGGQFFVVPQNMPVPEGLDASITVLQQPIENIYLVATSAMDLFDALDGIDAIRLSGTQEKGWCVQGAKEAMAEGKILYAGKYSAPDYELILSENCGLAVESTMIYHKPQVKEQLESFSIPVLVERSSYESHPLGRMEWIKLYGVLLGKEQQAEEFFNEQVEKVASVSQEENTKKTVAFFYINSNGSVNVRKSSDYVPKMIEMAGGNYVLQNLQEEDNALSTMNMQMEAFYAQAKDADVLIYNSTIEGELHNMEELLEKSSLLSEFKAVKEGNVWCTGQNLFQESTALADVILEIHSILKEEDKELTYLHPLTYKE